MTQFLIGTGGWSYFQVPGTPSLEAYSQAFNFVEVNTTFYKIPNLSLVNTWRKRVPQNFQFSVRCHKSLTHKYKLEPSEESHSILNKMVTICKTLRTNLLHMQVPHSLTFDHSKIRHMNSLFSSTNLKEIRIAWELKDAHHQKKSSNLLQFIKDHNMIHCVDLTQNEEPAHHNEVLYTRIFGKGKHNIYQPTDEELKEIHRKITVKTPKTAAVSFHSIKMYKDAARLQTYHKSGKLPMVTRSTGLNSLKEILKEDASFPSNKETLIKHQGWKIIDLTSEKRVRASSILQRLPERIYKSIEEVISPLKS